MLARGALCFLDGLTLQNVFYGELAVPHPAHGWGNG